MSKKKQTPTKTKAEPEISKPASGRPDCYTPEAANENYTPEQKNENYSV